MPNIPNFHGDCKIGYDAAKQGDFETALQEFKTLAENDDALAQYYLGDLYLSGLGVPRDFEVATKWFTLAADQGNAKAQEKMTVISSACKNAFFAFQQSDFATALRELTPLAEQGDARAQGYMGDLYLNGLGVPQDVNAATKWFTLAADQGNAEAQNNLAVISSERLFGRGYKDAVKWYTLAADQGYAPAQLGLGAMYDNGWGVDRDPNIAIKWYTLAAEQGYVDAQFNLGAMSMLGKGTPMDFTTARMWYLIAATQGHEQARSGLEKFEDALSPTDIETAERFACEWVEKHYSSTNTENSEPSVTGSRAAEEQEAVANLSTGNDNEAGKNHPSGSKGAAGEEKMIQSIENTDWSEKFSVLHEYDPVVKVCHDELNGIDPELSKQFREEVLSDRENASVIRDRLKTEYEKKLNPYTSGELNEGLSEARLLGSKAVAEFTKVVEVMGEDIDVDAVIKRIKEKYAANLSPDQSNNTA